MRIRPDPSRIHQDSSGPLGIHQDAIATGPIIIHHELSGAVKTPEDPCQELSGSLKTC